jgi:hypothetical protein
MVITLEKTQNRKNIFGSFLKFNSIILLFFLFSNHITAQSIASFPIDIVIEQSKNQNDFPVVADNGSAAAISYNKSDFTGVIRAIHDFQNDIDSVTGKRPELVTDGPSANFEKPTN